MALMWSETGLWQICMPHWTVHEKVDFPKFPPDTWGGIFHKNFQTVTTCFTAKNAKMHKYKTVPTCFTAKKYPKLLPKLIAVDTQQSWKQEWDVTIVIPTMHCNVTPDVTLGVYSTTFDPELRNTVNKFSNLWGVHSTTFHLELRNERFTLISFMEFPAILNTLQPFQICIFNRK